MNKVTQINNKLKALLIVSLIWLPSCAQIDGETASFAQNHEAFPELMPTGIVGGSEVQASAFLAKGVVALVAKMHGEWTSYCTGSLIAGNKVMTAAHCKLEGYPTGVAFGSNMLNLRDQDVYQMTDFIQHEDYVGDQQFSDDPANDIALVSFKGQAPKGYKAVTMLSSSSLLQNGRSVTLAGYGLVHGDKPDSGGVLRKVSGVQILEAEFNESEVLFDQSNNRGGCYGDSGGPAYLFEKGRYYLFGVTSRGPHPCTENSIYTNALAHSDWIAFNKNRLK